MQAQRYGSETKQTWKSSIAVEERDKHMTTHICKIPGLGSTTQDTAWLSKSVEGGLKQSGRLGKADLYGILRVE